MIAVGKSHSKVKGSVLLATDLKSNKPIYWIPHSEYPLQKPRGNPLDLVDGDWLLKNVFRKYGLGKKEIRLLTNFYKNPEKVALEIEDRWKVKAAFQALLDGQSSRRPDVTRAENKICRSHSGFATVP